MNTRRTFLQGLVAFPALGAVDILSVLKHPPFNRSKVSFLLLNPFRGGGGRFYRAYYHYPHIGSDGLQKEGFASMAVIPDKDWRMNNHDQLLAAHRELMTIAVEESYKTTFGLHESEEK